LNVANGNVAGGFVEKTVFDVLLEEFNALWPPALAHFPTLEKRRALQVMLAP
jgi:hypothetical protein